MIIWLASYPRSGNTLARLMLKEVFGCKTYVKRYRPPRPGERVHNPVLDLTDTTRPEGDWSEAYARMTKSEELCLVMTHDPPEDSARAVYIVRNGFASVISYQHYLREWRQFHFTLEEIILGKHRFGSWGYHLDAWQPLQRPSTLLLRYEDLVQNPDEQIAKLSEFCALRPQKPWVNEFDKLHTLHPAFFRKGETGDASGEFSDAQRELFWALHGDWMERLGYAKHFESTKALAQLRRWLVTHAQSQCPEKPDSVRKISSLRRMFRELFGSYR